MKAILNPKILLADDNLLRLVNETLCVLPVTLMHNVAVVVVAAATVLVVVVSA